MANGWDAAKGGIGGLGLPIRQERDVGAAGGCRVVGRIGSVAQPDALAGGGTIWEREI